MRKRLSFFLLAALVISVFSFGARSALAVDGIDGNPTFTLAVTGNSATEHVVGQLTGPGMDEYNSLHVNLNGGGLEMVYGKETDPSEVTPTSAFNSATGTSGVTGVTAIECTVDSVATSSTYKQFTCDFSG